VVVFFLIRSPDPLPKETVPVAEVKVDPIAAKIELADKRLKEGRFVGPGGDQALDILLAAKQLSPEDPRVTKRLKAIADRFQKLADNAIADNSLDEAATLLQVVITADPSRDGARQKIEEIEKSVRGD
jgi:hypothetical protein